MQINIISDILMFSYFTFLKESNIEITCVIKNILTKIIIMILYYLK